MFETGRLYFILYNSKVFKEDISLVFLQTAFKGFRLDLSAIAYCMYPIILVVLLEHLFKRKSPKWILRTIVILEMLIIGVISISDPELFIQWGNKFNNQVLVYINHPVEMALSAGAVNWLKTFLFLLVFIPICILFTKWIIKVIEKDYTFSWQYFSVVILIGGINFLFLRGSIDVSTISQASAVYSTNHAKNTAAINSLWNAMYYIVNDTRTLYGKEHIVIDQNSADSMFSEQIGDLDSFILTDETKPNILIVVLESFTSSASMYFSGDNNCTPYLDKTAQEGLSFMQCYSSGDRTEKGLVAVNSGYPAQPESSIIIFPDKLRSMPSISKSLKSNGYSTGFIYGGDAEFASMKSYLHTQDFTTIIDKSDYPNRYHASKWGLHDGQLFEKTMENLNGIQNPFYVLALTLSSHEPFDVPYKSEDLPKDEWYGYKNSLRYADKCLHDFLESCKQKSWYKNTLVILVADHGHEIGLENKHFFGKEKFHIPLIVTGGALKSSLRGVKIEQIVSQTIIPSLVMQSLKMDAKPFMWQTSVSHKYGFAQYQFSNGFGRVSKDAHCVYDNSGTSYYFKGDSTQIETMKFQGKVFQQVLIEDFLKK